MPRSIRPAWVCEKGVSYKYMRQNSACRFFLAKECFTGIPCRDPQAAFVGGCGSHGSGSGMLSHLLCLNLSHRGMAGNLSDLVTQLSRTWGALIQPQTKGDPGFLRDSGESVKTSVEGSVTLQWFWTHHFEDLLNVLWWQGQRSTLRKAVTLGAPMHMQGGESL